MDICEEGKDIAIAVAAANQLAQVASDGVFFGLDVVVPEQLHELVAVEGLALLLVVFNENIAEAVYDLWQTLRYCRQILQGLLQVIGGDAQNKHDKGVQIHF